MSEINIGQRVRVIDLTNSEAFVAIVSFIDDDSGKAEVLYEAKMPEEEVDVAMHRIKPLESFESVDSQKMTAQHCKDNGNVLFGLKDYITASFYYKIAIDKMKSQVAVALGSNVIVLNYDKGTSCIDGMVSDSEVNDRGQTTFEVMLSDQSEVTTTLDKLLPVPQDREGQVLLRSVYLNLARCEMKRNRKGWCVQYASIAVAISDVLRSDLRDRDGEDNDAVAVEVAEIRKLYADALYFRAKALLTAARPGLAMRDWKLLLHVDNTQRVTQLKQDVDAFRAKRTRDNLRLAKDVARWVDDVMSGKAQAENLVNDREDGDFALGDDDDFEEGISAASAIEGGKKSKRK